MNFIDWSNLIALVTVAGFLWRLTHTLTRDMRKLEIRMTDEMRTLEVRMTGEMRTLEIRMTGEMRTLGERVAKIEGALFSPPVGENKS